MAPSQWRTVVVTPLGLLVILSSGALLAPQLLGIADGPAEQLDERQLALRNRAHLNAYWVIGTAVMCSSGLQRPEAEPPHPAGLPDENAAQDTRPRRRLTEVMATAYRFLTTVPLLVLMTLLCTHDDTLTRLRSAAVSGRVAVVLILLPACSWPSWPGRSRSRN